MLATEARVRGKTGRRELPKGSSASRPVTVPERPHWQFQPGQSGNPKGRPPAEYDLSGICREHAPEAVKRLLAFVRDPDPKVALPATVYLLNRGFGMPPAKIEGVNPQSITVMHLIAARAVTDELMRALADNGSGAPTLDAESSQEPPDLCAPALE
jgi:hypothetical protein